MSDLNMEDSTKTATETSANVDVVPVDKTPVHVEVADEKKRDRSEELNEKITQMHVNTIINTITQALHGREFSGSNAVRVTYACVSVARKMKNGTAELPGATKKMLVLKALRDHMNKSTSLLEDDRELFMLLAADACDVLVEAGSRTSKWCFAC
jgi:hypothetical protein